MINNARRSDGNGNSSGISVHNLPMTQQPASRVPADKSIPVIIRDVAPAELHAAAEVLTRGMLDNPLHVRAFGCDPDLRQHRMAPFLDHLIGYVKANGEVLGAYVEGELVGVLGMIAPGRCRPTRMGALRFAVAILLSNSPATALRIRQWTRAWAHNDPNHPHWHIGPLAVQAHHRGRSVGRRLMMHCCQRMDALAATAYLETDLAINVAFYETFGFVVVRREPVLGVSNWFMSRPPFVEYRQ